MATTRRTSKPKRSPKGTVHPQTLDQFGVLIDEHLDRNTHFADLVRQLAVTKARIAAFKAARAALFEQVKNAYANGHRVVGGGYQLKMTDAGDPAVYRAVDSAAVKKADPRAWAAAKAVVPYVSVKPPLAWERRAAGVARDKYLIEAEYMAEAHWVDVSALVAAYKDHPAWAKLKELKADEEGITGALDKIAADAGWDGLAVTFVDGWTVSLRREQFSGEKLAALDPMLWDQVATTRVKQAAPRVYIGRENADDEALDDDGE